MAVIDVTNLAKSYDDFVAVNSISFHAEEGEVLAVLGPNGAGKTTTVEILEGYLDRTSGDVKVLGMDPANGGVELRRRIGIVLQECGAEPYLSVDPNHQGLILHSVYHRPNGWDHIPAARDVDEVIALVGLDEKAGSRVKTLSGGQQRRLDVALGLIGDPELLFLDEPTTGFDPTARRQAWEIVKNLRDLGKTVLLTTHYMDEAQALADRVIVLAAGEIVAEGTPDSIGGRADAAATITFDLPQGAAAGDLPVAFDAVTDGQVTIATVQPTAVLARLTSWAVDRGGPDGGELPHLSVHQPSLEDVYLALTAAAPEGNRTATGDERNPR